MKIDALKGKAFLITSLLTTTVLAADTLDSRVDTLEGKMKQIRAKTALGAYGAQTASARPQNTEGYGVFVTADAILWKVYEGGTFNQATSTSNSTTIVSVPISSTNDTQINEQDREFDWDFGYKFGLGYKTPYDGWDIYANFTHFITEGDKQSSDTAPTIPPTLAFGPGTSTLPVAFTFDNLADSATTRAKSYQTLHFYDVYLELGRSFFVSKYLSARPHFGIKSTWIRQKLTTDTLLASANLILLGDDPDTTLGPASTVTTTKGKNDFWGIGPTVGFDGTWYFNRYVGIYGMVDGALLWGSFNVELDENVREQVNIAGNNNITTNVTRTTAHPNHLAPMVHLELGLEWTSTSASNKYNFGMRVGYETQYWWRQNFLNDNNLNSAEDLGLHGLNLQLRFDF